MDNNQLSTVINKICKVCDKKLRFGDNSL